MTDLSPEMAAQIHKAAARLLRLARRADGQAGSGPAQVSVLSALAEQGSMTVTALADHEGVAQPTMSRMLKSMSAAGLVARCADPADRRRQRVEITRKGMRLQRTAFERRQAMIDALLAMLKPETRADLAEALKRLAQMPRPPA